MKRFGVSAFSSYLLPCGGGADDPTVLLQPNAKLAAHAHAETSPVCCH